MGHEPLFEADHEDVAELEAFGAVHRRQRHSIRRLFFVAILTEREQSEELTEVFAITLALLFAAKEDVDQRFDVAPAARGDLVVARTGGDVFLEANLADEGARDACGSEGVE